MRFLPGRGAPATGEGAWTKTRFRRLPAPPGYARGVPAPWWLKLGTKLAMAAVGLHGARARAFGIAEPSFTTLEPGRLLDAPDLWMRRAQAALGRRPRSLLELGPGRMVLRAPVLALRLFVAAQSKRCERTSPARLSGPIT